MRRLLLLLTGFSLLGFDAAARAAPAALAAPGPAAVPVVMPVVMPEKMPATISICKARAGVPVTLALFATVADFKAQANAAATLSLQPTAEGMAAGEVILPPGRYAAAAFQDLDGDGRLTTNFLGIPKEPYGFSGTDNKFGMPTFAEAGFSVPAAMPVLVCLHSF